LKSKEACKLVLECESLNLKSKEALSAAHSRVIFFFDQPDRRIPKKAPTTRQAYIIVTGTGEIVEAASCYIIIVDGQSSSTRGWPSET
jgi:hypothetical protein